MSMPDALGDATCRPDGGGGGGPADPRIEVRGLCKAFGGKPVLKGVDFAVGRGESLVIVGPSGCGKSVTMRCVLGLERPDGGEMRVDGRRLDARGIAALRRRCGVLFQGGALFDSLPVWRNVMFRPLHEGMRPSEARSRADACLRLVDLDSAAGDLLPADLSGGMRKRVALARAIADSPEILVFDEPTAGLDPILSAVVSKLIRRLVDDLGATAVTITHNLACAETVGDRVGLLYGGGMKWRGEISLLRKSGNPYVEQFIQGAAEGPIATL